MPIDYVARIRQYDTAQLVILLQDIRAGRSTVGWPRGRAFEYLVLRGFELDAAEVEWPYNVPFAGSVIEQIDGGVYIQNTLFLIESKDYQKSLNIEPVAKLRYQLMRRPLGTMEIVFGRSNFTIPLKHLTRMTSPPQVLLWEVEELEYALQTQATRLANNLPGQGMCKALQLKFRMAAKLGMPDYDVRRRL